MKRVCVYCGSSVGANPVHRAAAENLGVLLASRGIGKVITEGECFIARQESRKNRVTTFFTCRVIDPLTH